MVESRPVRAVSGVERPREGRLASLGARPGAMGASEPSSCRWMREPATLVRMLVCMAREKRASRGRVAAARLQPWSSTHALVFSWL